MDRNFTPQQIPVRTATRRTSRTATQYWVAITVVGLTLFVVGTASAQSDSDKSKTLADWPMFRGNPLSTGVAAGSLPDKLEVLWTFKAKEFITATAAIVGDRVYVVDDDGMLYSIDLNTGKERWRYAGGEPIRSSPTVYKNTVFFGDSAGMFHAVNTENGTIRWKFETAGEIISSANPVGDRVVFGSYDGKMYCLAVSDGSVQWTFATEGRIHGTPAVVDDKVIFAGCDEHLHVLSLGDGSTQSSVPLGSVSGASAAIVGDMAYVGTYGHKVLGINWKSGSVVWTFEDPERQFPYLASAAVSKGIVVVTGRDKRIRGLEAATGKQVWEVSTQGRNDASPVILGDRVYQPSSDGNLYVLELSTGKELFRFEAGVPMSASPAIGRNRLIISDEDGLVYCLGARESDGK